MGEIMLDANDPILTAYTAALREFCQYRYIKEYIAAKQLDKGVHILAIGKAACGMASVALKALPNGAEDGFVLTKHGFSRGSLSPLEVLEAGHPIPDEDSLRHSKRIMNWLEGLDPLDELLVLVSGGGSALFEYPAEGTEFARLQSLHRAMLDSGTDIREMNRRRSHLSAVKAGKTLDRVGCGSVHVLMLSDVPGHAPSVIASGPFTPPGLPLGAGVDSTFGAGYKGISVSLRVAGRNLDLAELIAKRLQSMGIYARVGKMDLFFPVSRMPDRVRDMIASCQPEDKHIAWIMGGEMPVRVTGTGRGGRCTHLALMLADVLNSHSGWRFYCLATDGNDFLPGITGGYCDVDTLNELRAKGIDPVRALQDSDSFSALNAIGNIIPSRGEITNVNDIYILARDL